MRRPTFLRVYSSDATEKDDEATPINRSDSDDVRNSIDKGFFAGHPTNLRSAAR